MLIFRKIVQGQLDCGYLGCQLVRQGWNREAAAINSRPFYFHKRVVRFLLHTRSYKSYRMDVELVYHYVVSNSVKFLFVHLLKRSADKGRP